MVRKNMKNSEIYSIGMQLAEHVINLNLSLPVKVNFYLQKNINALMAMATELEQARNGILERYGTLNPETNQYDFEDDKLVQANQELMDLFELEQEVPIYEISLEAFGDAELSSKQVNAISYMIKEEE